MNEDLEQRIKRVVCDTFLGGDMGFPIERDMSFIKHGICDSMGLVTLAAALEREFDGLKIQDQDISHEGMGSIAAVGELIGRMGAA